MKWSRVVAVSVRRNRLGMVCLLGRDVLDWKTSEWGAKSPENAAVYAKRAIALYEPTLFVTEDTAFAVRKAEQTIRLINALAEVGAAGVERHMAVERVQRHRNKHEEALAIAKRHPAMAQHLPKQRRLWESEPRQYVLFEALALAEEALCALPPDEQ